MLRCKVMTNLPLACLVAAACMLRCDALRKGFGAAPPKSRRPQLTGVAKKFYTEHEGDLDSVQADLFGHYLQNMRARDPDLYADLVKAQRRDEAATARGKEALVALTWDVIADCLPVMGGEDAAMTAKLAACAAAVPPGAVLDVGCGDGAMVPHLARAGVLESYVGIDVSERMVAAARRRHPKRTFEAVGFLDYVGGPFDSVLFAGSLQFFAGAAEALGAAAALLKPGGAVVVAHARGAAFVRDEARGNPATARPLPTLDELAAAAAPLGLDVASAGDNLEAAYLVVLKRRG